MQVNFGNNAELAYLVGRYDGNYALGDIAIVPYSLIGVVRSGLQTQNVDPMIVKDDGSLDYARLITSAFDTVEIRTTATPNWRIDLKPGAPPPEGAPPQLPFVASLKPTVVLSGRFGKAVIAPYGVAEGSGTLATGLKVVGALLVGLLAWKVF